MPISPETEGVAIEVQKLSLDRPDLLWLYLHVLHNKPQVVQEILLWGSATNNTSPFFHIMFGRVLENGTQSIHFEWSTIAEDSEALKILIHTLGNNYRKSTNVIKKDLEGTSPLFRQLSSNTILTTKEQVDANNIPLPPLEHIQRVASFKVNRKLIPAKDRFLVNLIAWAHDIAKMVGVNYLSRNDITDITKLRKQLKIRFNEDGKHTHPAHSEMAIFMLQELFLTLEADDNNLDPYTDLGKLLNNNNRCMDLLLNVIFHHHDFIYDATKHGSLENWLPNEIETRLYPTIGIKNTEQVSAEEAALVVRFFILLFQFRLADINATPAHHGHWETNMTWIHQTPDILRTKYAVNQPILKLIDKLDTLIKSFPENL